MRGVGLGLGHPLEGETWGGVGLALCTPGTPAEVPCRSSLRWKWLVGLLEKVGG